MISELKKRARSEEPQGASVRGSGKFRYDCPQRTEKVVHKRPLQAESLAEQVEFLTGEVRRLAAENDRLVNDFCDFTSLCNSAGLRLAMAAVKRRDCDE